MRIYPKSVLSLILSLSLISPLFFSEARAETGEGAWRAQSDVLLRADPIGLAWLPRLGYRVPLSDSSHILLSGTHVETGFVASVSPATLHLGGYFKVVPIAPVVFKVEAQQLRFLGLFGQIRTFENPPDWHELDGDLDVTEGRHATGYKVRAESTLRFVAGPVLGIGSYSGHWVGADVDGDQTWYDPTIDMIFERNDFMHEMHANLAYIAYGGPKASEFLAIGGRWHRLVTEKSDFERQMIGGLVIWKPGILTDRDLTILTTICGYTEDPHRTGIYAAGALRMSWETFGGSTP